MAATYRAPDDEWLASLPEDTRAKADSMIALLAQLRADNPVALARAEITEDSPEVMRFLFLSAIRCHAMDNYLFVGSKGSSLPKIVDPGVIGDEAEAAFKRLIASGSDVNDILRISRASAAEAVNDVVNILDDGHNWDAPDEAPGWTLVETVGDEITGRHADGLHESLFCVFDDDAEFQK